MKYDKRQHKHEDHIKLELCKLLDVMDIKYHLEYRMPTIKTHYRKKEYYTPVIDIIIITPNGEDIGCLVEIKNKLNPNGYKKHKQLLPYRTLILWIDGTMCLQTQAYMIAYHCGYL